MRLPHHFAYLQARLQARYGGLAQEDEWQRLMAARSLSAYLEEARMGPLREWVKGFSGQSEAHDLEAAVRGHFLETAERVAGWMPKEWRAAVAWTRWLPFLPLFDHLARGEPMPGWVVRDRGFRLLLEDDGSLNRYQLQRAGTLCLSDPTGPLVAVWVAEWRRRWPRCGADTRASVESLVKLLEDHTAVFVQTAPQDTWATRRQLRQRLGLLFHQRLLQPVAAFVYLALVALDLERLRAGLVTRALFGGQEEAS